jgi:hypothetical protein
MDFVLLFDCANQASEKKLFTSVLTVCLDFKLLMIASSELAPRKEGDPLFALGLLVGELKVVFIKLDAGVIGFGETARCLIKACRIYPLDRIHSETL